jgi:hypothetical protein
MEHAAEAVASRLFEDEDLNVFGIFDGASIPDLRAHLYNSELEYECLYRGELEPDMAEVAPYLVRLDPASSFTNWVLEQGWGKHWGIFLLSHEALATLRRHFRRFLVVHDSDGKPLYFRFYDPRVLRVYLPTCKADELEALFGPVDRYLMEDQEPGGILTFHNNSGVLAQRKEEIKED